jgi:acyl carrier protein phosphodiesterase
MRRATELARQEHQSATLTADGFRYDGGMNFLAHLYLAGDNDGLRLGAMLGDFVRGKKILSSYQDDVRLGIELHRHIDQHTDSLPDIANLRRHFPPPFRRYGGIVIDLAYDHELARRWEKYSNETLRSFDRNVRELLSRHESLVPDRLRRFMSYADRRGLFAAYREESEILRSLHGIGKRLSRPNPLHRIDDIWLELAPDFSASFEVVFPQIQSDVAAWLKSRSTTTGS